MSLKCIAVDDEPLALQLIASYVKKIPALQLLQTFEDAVSASEYLRSTAVDILFIDINMPDITGIELVRSLTTKPLIIFTTAHKKFAYEGFELEAVDYLLKPIDFPRFSKAVQKAIDFHEYKNAPKNIQQESIFVRSEYKMIRVDVDNIEYIEGLEDYIKIHITDSRPILTLSTLKAFVEKLPADKFVRIHRSYIVPYAKIKTVVNKKIKLSSNTELPISDTYAPIIDEWMKK